MRSLRKPQRRIAVSLAVLALVSGLVLDRGCSDGGRVNASVEATNRVPRAEVTSLADVQAKPAVEPAQDSDAKVVEFSAEENIASEVWRIGSFGNGLSGTFSMGVRTITWRTLGKQGATEPTVRFSYGLWGADPIAELAAGSAFQEDRFVQLTVSECRNLRKMVNRLNRAKYDQRPTNLSYRLLSASLGGVRLRKQPTGQLELFFSSDSEIGELWYEVKAATLVAFIDEALANVEKLNKQQRSVAW